MDNVRLYESGDVNVEIANIFSRQKKYLIEKKNVPYQKNLLEQRMRRHVLKVIHISGRWRLFMTKLTK